MKYESFVQILFLSILSLLNIIILQIVYTWSDNRKITLDNTIVFVRFIWIFYLLLTFLAGRILFS